MLTIVPGDVTRPQGAGQKIIAHIVNNFGIWGTRPAAGLVYHLRQRWPHARASYLEWATGVGAYQVPFELGAVLYIDVAPSITLAHIVGQHGIRVSENRRPIRYEAVEHGFRNLATVACALSASVHMAFGIGAGRAGGDIGVIHHLIETTLVPFVDVTLYQLTEA